MRDGGPAFPTHTWLDENRTIPMGGMSLRDYFAGQALGSIMQDRAIWDSTPDEELDIARRMYRWSDAMLAVRSTPEGN